MREAESSSTLDGDLARESSETVSLGNATSQPPDPGGIGCRISAGGPALSSNLLVIGLAASVVSG